ncbi:hypothetical protein NKR23_g9006 [Pleurostoma richardsiae]|uniref:FAD-binding FR-type domain-containing protein n=1 Tax=Pleurostoma richardsiae TaxID=41990 RepID=A0AA38R6S4_9PEZI|nr:hypothetical protein NKR23_g9006 [Pleurostoma richardsiae]
MLAIWYAVSVAGVLACLGSYQLWSVVARSAELTSSAFIHYVYHETLWKEDRRLPPPTLLQGLLMLGLLAANAIVICVGPSGGDKTRNLRTVALLNYMFLCEGFFFRLLAGRFSRAYQAFHVILGAITIVEIACHAVISRDGSDGQSSHVRWVCLALALALALPIFTKAHWPTCTARLHSAVWAGLLVFTWLHVPARPLPAPPRVFLVVASGTYAATWLLWGLVLLYSNVPVSPRKARFRPGPLGSRYLRIDIDVPRHWTCRPGQYVRVCAPGISLESVAVWPAFVVAWRERGRIVILADLGVSFARWVAVPVDASSSPRAELLIVDGPYGDSISLRKFGSVFFFATGLGISAQLLYMRQLVEDSVRRRTCCRSLTLYWEISDAGIYELLTSELRSIMLKSLSVGPQYFIIKLVAHPSIEIKLDKPYPNIILLKDSVDLVAEVGRARIGRAAVLGMFRHGGYASLRAKLFGSRAGGEGTLRKEDRFWELPLDADMA